MIPPDDMLHMLADRAHHPSRAIVEAVMLRAALDRLDDFCADLDLTIADDPDTALVAGLVCQTLAAIRARIDHELHTVDATLTHVRDEVTP